jgi:hypothetical protein
MHSNMQVMIITLIILLARGENLGLRILQDRDHVVIGDLAKILKKLAYGIEFGRHVQAHHRIALV